MTAEKRTRRIFLGRAARTGLGLVLMHSLPTWAWSGQRHRKAYRERSFYAMGSIATVSAYGESTVHIDDAINKVIHEFGRLDTLLSVFNPASEISLINTAAGHDAIRVSREVCQILELAKNFNAQTTGLFDITVEPLMRLWGFRGVSRQSCPSEKEITGVLNAVGMDHLNIDSNRQGVFLDHPNSSVDLGGIAVGYAVDRAVGIMRSAGIEAAFINHAGDAFALGAPDDQDGWTAVVPDPSKPETFVHKEVLTDRAISTSAYNERFVTIADRRYGHVMDVRSGGPGDGLACVTVMAPSAVQADAYSTAAFCRPDVLAKVPETSYFVVERAADGVTVHSRRSTR